MLARLFASRRRPPLASADALIRFLCENASLITQKTLIGYCYARTSLPLSELMRDKPFADAFERGRWLAYTAVLEDMFVVAEGRLRPATTRDHERVGQALAARFEAALSDVAGTAIDPPAQNAAADRLRARLVAVLAEAPGSIGDTAQVSGQRVYEAMPIHERHRHLDRGSIIAGVRFLMVGLATEFDRRLDAPRVIADLLGSSPATASPA